MKEICILFWALWLIAFITWLVFIINRRTREKRLYFYPLIAMVVINTANAICIAAR